eukprot:1717881-Pyramimonas_sp.AAC.1
MKIPCAVSSPARLCKVIKVIKVKHCRTEEVVAAICGAETSAFMVHRIRGNDPAETVGSPTASKPHTSAAKFGTPDAITVRAASFARRASHFSIPVSITRS